MKFLTITSLLALSNAFVLPDEQVFSELAIEDNRETKSAWDKVPSAKELLEKVSQGVEGAFDGVADKAENIIDRILDATSETQSHIVDATYETAFDVQGWLDTGSDGPPDCAFDNPESHLHDGPPHDGPPHRGPPHRRRPPHHGPPHHGHPRKANLTIYELISKSKYTTKLAKLIGEYDDLVELLNGTSANFTVFAPTDKAFDKIPKHAPKPSKEFLKKLLTYHVSPSFYPARRVIASDTIPSALNESDTLGGPQRLAVQLSFKGLMVNFYSRVIAPNIFATNGVIHGVDSILIPPPTIGKLLDLLPQEFSTLLLAFEKTGLGGDLAKYPHVGATVFAPGNFAFKKLGPGPNAFLFSKPGLKYLKALLKYHLVANTTLYSDTVYGADDSAQAPDDDVDAMRPRKHVHIDLPTLLDGRSLPVDLVRYGPFISFKVNGYVRIAVKDGIAKDGVVHVPADVLIPPKTKPGSEEVDYYQGGEISVEELKERLSPLVEDGDAVEDDGMKWEM